MLDPDLTNILKRRVSASLIDFGIVGLVTTIVWRTQLIAFPISRTDSVTGRPIWDAAQIARRDEIAARLNTSFTWGNTEYALDQSGLVLTALCALVMLALVFILVPANTGWSPGKKLLGLAVIDADGENPSIGEHAKRSVVGVVDLLPVVIPGLAGWILASSHEYHQRLGDRVAKTYVIDNRAGAKFIDPSVYERRRELRRSTRVAIGHSDDDDDAMVEISDRLGTSPSGLHRDAQEWVEGSSAEEATASALTGEQAVPHASEEWLVGAVSRHRDDVPSPGPASLDELDRPHEQTAPPIAAPPIAAPPIAAPPHEAPTEVPRPDLGYRADGPTPTPNHRFAVDAHAPTNELGFVEDDRPDLGFGTDNAASAPRTSTPSAAPDIAPEIVSAIAAPPTEDRAEGRSVPAPMPTHRGSASTSEPEWEQPTPEVAPVWEPSGEPPPTTSHSNADTPTDDTSPVNANDNAISNSNGLVWNDQWQAWLFWDATHEHWLRHDLDNDRWVAIS